jgi:hypothetical protein
MYNKPMTSLTFKCPMCGNQMKQIHFGKGRPNIKIEFDMGDGTSGTINTSFMFCSIYCLHNHYCTYIFISFNISKSKYSYNYNSRWHTISY